VRPLGLEAGTLLRVLRSGQRVTTVGPVKLARGQDEAGRRSC